MMEESKRSELEQGSIGTILIKYAAPSVISMLFFGLQSLIDGIVVGNYIGDKALGGINIILPVLLRIALQVISVVAVATVKAGDSSTSTVLDTVQSTLMTST